MPGPAASPNPGTSAGPTPAPAGSRGGGSGWLFGPGTDVLLGCGGFYLLLFALMTSGAFGIPDDLDAVLGPYLVLIFSVPHYGATLLRVYQHREDRQRYRLFALWGAVLVYGLFFVGLNAPVFGAWFLTLYLTWSPWHYTGQNFGIAIRSCAGPARTSPDRRAACCTRATRSRSRWWRSRSTAPTDARSTTPRRAATSAA